MFGLSFLQPVLLWGALAAGVPLVLHLLRRQRYRDLPFSGLIFVSANLRRQLRASHLTHLLLLLLRMALLVVLAVALAGPEVGGLGLRSRATSLAIVVDQSASMGVRTGGRTALQRAVALAEEIVRESGAEDRITLVGALRSPRTYLADRPGSREAALEALSRLEPTALAGDLGAGVREAMEILDVSELKPRRLLVLTDGQEPLEPGLTAGARGVDVEVRTVRPEAAANLYIRELNVPRLSEARSEQRFSVRVANGGSARALGSVRLNVAGAYLGERPVDLRPGASEEIRFDTSVSAGVHFGFVELTGDDLDADNWRFFVLGLEERIPVVVVGPAASRRYVELALGARHPAGGGAFDVRSAETVASAEAALTAEPGARVLVLCGLPALGVAERQRLERLHAGGAAMLVFLGSETVPSLVNDALGPGSFLPLRLTGREAGAWRARAQVARHAALPEPAALGALLGEVELRERHRVVPLGEGAATLLAFDDGEPLLAELRTRAAPILVMTSSPDRAFGDFVLSPYFVLLLRRAAAALDGRNERRSVPAGTFLAAPHKGRWEVVADPADLRPRPLEGKALLRPAAVVRIGEDGRPEEWKAVVVESSESFLAYPGRPAGAAAAAAEEGAPRRSIVLPLVLLALATFLAEGLLTARLTAQEATG
jgi:hypothetical protein